MSILASSPSTAPIDDTIAPNAGSWGTDGVVEINLLLPSEWAQDLIQLSRERRQSVGQILRSMIGHALHESAAQS
jgi:hypothetical protein